SAIWCVNAATASLSAGIALGTGVVSSAGNEAAAAGDDDDGEPLGRAVKAALGAERDGGSDADGAATADALADAAACEPEGLLHASTRSPKRPNAEATGRAVTPRM